MDNKEIVKKMREAYGTATEVKFIGRHDGLVYVVADFIVRGRVLYTSLYILDEAGKSKWGTRLELSPVGLNG